jgi:ribose transport system permease protein
MSRALGAIARAPAWAPPLTVLALMLGLIEALRPGSFAMSHLAIEASEAMTLILIATGQTIVVLRGGIDLSLGGTLSLATAIAATRIRDLSFVELLPWLVVILVVGTVVGAINGALISGLRLQPFVVTLATWSIIGGIALIILPVNQSSVPAAWFEAGNAKILDLVPAPIALFLVLLAWWAWFRRTRWAFRIRAAGSDERGAFLNRVSLTRTNVVAYGLAGFFAALAGLFFSTQTGSGSPVVGTQFILPSIAAVVIGGTNLAGGRGGVIGTVIGAFILNQIADVIFLVGLSSYWQQVASGLILVGVVLLTPLLEIAAERTRQARGRPT